MKKPSGKKAHPRAVTPGDRLIGQRLKARRLEQHMSQGELGDKLGVSFQQVQKYEKGVNRVGSARLKQIADALETNFAYFLDDTDGKMKTSPIHAFLATKDGIDINEAMIKLDNPELRRSVIDFVRKLGNVYGEAGA
ncbi:transcriptional regulator with XRE-family HTH domain [Bradyrhizobium barranii subsp. barranii]|uniref:helix-turn-helix domain-containing protein n=1 Tax=Bradyrhizobium TaxID=374 RepID=UPI001BA87E08|nr:MULTISPECIES: helix-turn-helix transcriptional regulator [Bradyrhizobium]MBR0879599.1 helix-turn-helix transcriptional regulator [Bradyrhizobium liaoningense]MCP1778849.1 transcriptional regulator with XRE-family HTH domain [Bradyrhizobium japonicum]MCP1958153.1 transcriptional regulator with XRE-family HTH domain [Bradyrhizobium japonicum]